MAKKWMSGSELCQKTQPETLFTKKWLAEYAATRGAAWRHAHWGSQDADSPFTEPIHSSASGVR